MKKPKTEKNPRAERIPFQILVAYAFGDVQVTRFCSNFSSGGIFVETLDALPVGANVKLKFSFPMDKKEVAVTARVAWIREASTKETPGMGLEFTNLDDDNKAMIIRAIDYLKVLSET